MNKKELFFDVWRNIYIKSKILSFLNTSNGFSYNGTHKLEILIENKKYEILLDKLKNNQHISISEFGLNLFLIEYLDNPLFEETLELLWSNYSDIIYRLNPLKLLLFEKDSTNIFKYIFNKYYNNNNNNNNTNHNNHISINSTFMLYDLLDKILKSERYYNQNQIWKFIIEKLNENRDNNILNNELEIVKSNLKRTKLNNNNFNIDNNNYNNLEQLEQLIYSKKELKFKDIPIILKDNFVDIENDYKDKLVVLNELGFNTVKLCDKFKGDLFSVNGSQEPLFVFIQYKYLECKETINLLWKLVINNGYNVIIEPNELYFNHLEFLKFLLISRVPSIKVANYKKLLVENHDNITSIGSLIKLVENYIDSCNSGGANNIIDQKKAPTKEEELYFYFDVYLIYYYLQENNLKMVQYYLDTILRLEKLGNKRNYGEIRADSIALLFYYSIISCSIPVFNLYNDKYKHQIDFIQVCEKQFNFLNLSVNVCKDDAIKFFGVLVDSNLSTIHYHEINRIVVSNYNGELFDYVINHKKETSDIYYQSLESVYHSAFYSIISGPYSKEDTVMDLKKLDVFINSLQNCDDKLIDSENMPKRLSSQYIPDLLAQIISNGLGKQCSLFHEFTIHTLLYSYSLEIDDSIKVYKKIDQSSLLKYFEQDILGKETKTYITLSNKSNILNHHFFESIYENNNINLIKIVNALNNDDINSNTQLQDIINNNSNIFNNSYQLKNNNIINLEKIKILIKSKLLNNFNLKDILEYMIIGMKASKEYILELIQSLNQEEQKAELLQYFREYFGEIVTIHYDINYGEIKISAINKKSTFVKAFTSGNLKQIYEYFETRGPLKKPINRIQLYQLIQSNEICYSIEWFKKLYDKFLKIHLDQETTLQVAINGSFEVFEFLWEYHLTTNQVKIQFLKDLLKFSQDNLDSFNLIEYILKEKKQFIINLLGTSSSNINDNPLINQLFASSLFFGNLRIFKVLRSNFPDFKLKLNYNNGNEYTLASFLETMGSSSYCSDVILYLLNNNIITASDLKDSMDEINSKSNVFSFTFTTPKSTKSLISKSNLILIYSIIKSYN